MFLPFLRLSRTSSRRYENGSTLSYLHPGIPLPDVVQNLPHRDASLMHSTKNPKEMRHSKLFTGVWILLLSLLTVSTSCQQEIDAPNDTKDEQMTTINNSIKSLTDTDKALHGYIETLQTEISLLKAEIEALHSKDDGLSEQVADLELTIAQIEEKLESLHSKDSELEKSIDELKSYVDSQVANNRDWANATFATLEQFSDLNDIVSDIKSEINSLSATLEQKASDLKSEVESLFTKFKQEVSESDAQLGESISNFESTLKSWVEEKLKEYYTKDETDEKIKALGNQLVAFQSQLDELSSKVDNHIESVNASIESLEAVDETLKEYIAALQGEVAAIKAEIETLSSKDGEFSERIAALESTASQLSDKIGDLQAKDTELEAAISNLKTHVNEQISETRDWAESTFSTLEQFNALKDIVSGIQSEVEKYHLLPNIASIKVDLEKSVSDLEGSLKNWVNKCLEEYYTKDEIDDRFSSLESALESFKSELSSLSSKIDGLINQIQSAVVIPTYSDGAVDIYNYECTIDFEIRPLSIAEALVKEDPANVTLQAVPVKKTKASSYFVEIPAQKLEYKDGIISVTLDGEPLGEDFFRERQLLAAKLVIENGTIDYSTSFFNLVPNRISKNYVTFTSEGTSTISIRCTSGYDTDFQYSYDGMTWKGLSRGKGYYDSQELVVRKGMPLYMRNAKNVNHLNAYQFVTSGDNFSVEGKIMSLRDHDNENMDSLSGVFSGLFKDCTNLKAPRNLFYQLKWKSLHVVICLKGAPHLLKHLIYQIKHWRNLAMNTCFVDVQHLLMLRN